MRFANIEMLQGLWTVITVTGLLYFMLKRREKVLRRFAGTFTDEIAADYSSRRQVVKTVLVVVVLILSVAALARPQWGFEWQEVTRKGLDIFVVIDTSKSMLTSDVKPSRLERTKLAVKDFVQKLRGDRVGLIAFAGDAFLVCPLTVDYSGFLLALSDLDTGTIPKGGTNVGSAVDEALKGYEKVPAQYKVLVVITDGENLEGDPLAFAQKAKAKGVKIFTIGVGTQEGELIRIRNPQGEYEFLKDSQDNFVKSRLNEGLLQQIALTSDGVYIRSSGTQFGLDLIYDRELSAIEKRELESKMQKKYHERFQIPLAMALLLLLAETALGTRKP